MIRIGVAHHHQVKVLDPEFRELVGDLEGVSSGVVECRLAIGCADQDRVALTDVKKIDLQGLGERLGETQNQQTHHEDLFHRLTSFPVSSAVNASSCARAASNAAWVAI